MKFDKCMDEMINNTKVHGAILVIGAGASFESGLPLYSQFPTIIWKVVDKFPKIKTELKYSDTNSAKDIIGNDVEMIKKSFSAIERYPSSDTEFKKEFKKLVDSHKSKNSSVYENICKLIHNGNIKLVISFNWDDLLETSWENLYGTNINAQKLTLLKPHGDVREMNKKWIYPNSDGNLSENDKNSINHVISNSFSIFLILGYSEQDKKIVDELIKPNEKDSVIYRLSPTATGENSIQMKASEITQQMVSNLLDNDVSFWTQLNFQNQGGLERALLGQRLLPSDVLACPRLKQLDEIKTKLDNVHFVIIQGKPGSGKSISAYQIAWDYLGMGWEVLRLREDKLKEQSIDKKLQNDGYKTVYIIDDAQLVEKELIIKLMTQANSNKKLIITQTITADFPNESVTLLQEEAVESLYIHYKNNKDSLLPLIQSFNQRYREIGDNPHDTSFEFVLDVAKRERTPWLFNYSLRGGWESTKTQFKMAKENDRADILLVLISLRQILMLDKPVEQEWIREKIQRYGYDNKWIKTQLEYLHKQKFIIDVHSIRTLHLQMAIRVIVNYLNSTDSVELQYFYELFRNEIIDEDTPLQGINWFFDLMFGFEKSYQFKYNVFTNEVKHRILKRCRKQTTSSERAKAMQLINDVICREMNIHYKDIIDEIDFLVEWFNNTDNETAFSYANVLNNMINESFNIENDFIDKLNMLQICENMKKIDINSLYGWAHFIDRLANSSHKERKRSFKVFCMNLPKCEISKVLRQCSSKSIYALSEMLCVFKDIDEEYCYTEYYNSLGIIKEALNKDLTNTLNELSLHFDMYILGARLFNYKKPSENEIKARESLVDCISINTIKNSIFNGVPRDWDVLYRWVDIIELCDPQKMISAIKDEDLSVLDKVVEDIWTEAPDALVMLLLIIHSVSPEMTDNWIYSNKDKINKMTGVLIQFSPKTAKYISENGKDILIAKQDRWTTRWEMDANAISALKDFDKIFCKKVINQNISNIKQSFYDLTLFYSQGYLAFLRELIKLGKRIFRFEELELDGKLLESKWINLFDKNYSPSIDDLKSFKKIVKLVEKQININTLNIVEKIDIKIKYETKRLKELYSKY